MAVLLAFVLEKRDISKVLNLISGIPAIADRYIVK